jgi:ribosomal-protein-alanine N-acetyltransferase
MALAFAGMLRKDVAGMRHKGTQTIETERLVLRRLLPEDAEQMYRNWASDPCVTRWLRWQPHQNVAETRALLAAWAELYPNPDYYQWCLVEKSSGSVFGSIGLFDDAATDGCRPNQWKAPGLAHSEGAWMPGYCIGAAWWGKGYTTEALKAVVDYWFSGTDSSWLACCHAVENPASGHVMRHAGFCFDHAGIDHKFDGTPVDCLFYCLTRAQWAAGAAVF